MDLDKDGRTDVISGSAPGEVYFFRHGKDGGFEDGRQITDRDGKSLNVGNGSTPFAADWDGDNDLDLIIGTAAGTVAIIRNERTGTGNAFSQVEPIVAAGQPIKALEAAPAVADWDGDGRHDLVVGCEDGSVVWYRNTALTGEPQLEAARMLIGPSPAEWRDDSQVSDRQWGLRVKICVTDFNGDGLPDLLLGDRCGGFEAKPTQTLEEAAEDALANERLPKLSRQWSESFARYRSLLAAAKRNADSGGSPSDQELDAERKRMQELKEQISRAQATIDRYRPQRQDHGYVWFFARRPSATANSATEEEK